MRQTDRPSTPDRGWSWVVAFSCCFSSLILAGIFRTSGVLFVAFIGDYGVSREEASWPMVLCISVLNLTGPLSGVLARKFGGRPVIIAGAVVASVGISACYLTTSLGVITILFGGVFGVGYGFMNTIMPGILNAYFLNLRATANGIANAGSCVGSILLPVAFEHFIHTYGLSGCFLLTGGMVLHITIAGALMRPPPWLSVDTDHGDAKKPSFKDTSVLSMKNSPVPCVEVIGAPTETSSSRLLECERNGDSTDVAAAPVSRDIAPAAKNEISSPPKESNPSDGLIVHCEQKTSQNSVFDATKNTPSALSPLAFGDGNKNVTHNRLAPDSTCDPFGEKFSRTCMDVVEPFRTVLSCPMFYVTGVTNVSFYFLYHMYVVIIVDYALDENVPEENTKYILFAFSLADLFGRLCFGWITDRRFVSRPRYVMGCMMLIGVVFFLFPFAKGFWPLVAVSCGYGLLLGSTMVVFPILLVDFLGIELHSVSYGCMCFMNGFASFGRPFLIGYFRDNVGSYSNMFYVLGTLSALASTLWLLEGLFDNKRPLFSKL